MKAFLTSSEYLITNRKQQMFNLPSPIGEVFYPPFSFRLLVKRDDLIHPLISGNKYRKLKYNLMEAKASNTQGVISFGGVYSNHLHALAAACHYENLPFTAIEKKKKKK